MADPFGSVPLDPQLPELDIRMKESKCYYQNNVSNASYKNKKHTD